LYLKKGDGQMAQRALAWHESLELHELTVIKTIGLMKLKKGINQIKEPGLRQVYEQTIKDLELTLGELLQFYPHTPKPGESEQFRSSDIAFYAGDLLAFSKFEVRAYAIAITETATPILRDILQKHLNMAIQCHERIFNYMYKKGLYPSYDLNQLFQNDVFLAQKALKM
jgi:spore coat protein F